MFAKQTIFLTCLNLFIQVFTRSIVTTFMYLLHVSTLKLALISRKYSTSGKIIYLNFKVLIHSRSHFHWLRLSNTILAVNKLHRFCSWRDLKAVPDISSTQVHNKYNYQVSPKRLGIHHFFILPSGSFTFSFNWFVKGKPPKFHVHCGHLENCRLYQY